MKTPERTPAQLPPLDDLFEDPAISEGKKTEMLRALREHAHLRTPTVEPILSIFSLLKRSKYADALG